MTGTDADGAIAAGLRLMAASPPRGTVTVRQPTAPPAGP